MCFCMCKYTLTTRVCVYVHKDRRLKTRQLVKKQFKVMMRFHPGVATATGRPATRAAWRQWPLMKVFEEEEEEEAAEAEVEWLMKKLSSRSLTCSGLSSCNLASEMSPLMAAISASVGWTDGYTHTHTFRYMYKWRPSQIEI